MNKKLLMLVGVVVGVGFLVLAFLYATNPASALPGFLPGYDMSSQKIHIKHAIGALFLGLGALAFAWFQTGTKSSQPEVK